MNKKPPIVIAGGSGFLGRVLADHFRDRFEIVILTRSPKPETEPGIRKVPWDGRTPGAWAKELEAAAALINLAGRSVDCRYHLRNRRLIMDSRIESTRALGEAVATCKHPPPVWLNASTATIYKHSLDRPMDEATGLVGATPEAKDAFSVDVATAWEKTFFEAAVPAGVRKVALRSAMVLGNYRNSVFPVLRRLARNGLSGTLASGRQFVSWIHQRDFCRAVDWILTHRNLDGCVNLAAPNPLPNAEMMSLVRKHCKALFGIGLPAPEWLLEVGAFFLRTETELVIKSRRVIPARLLADGFRFQFEIFEDAVKDLKNHLPMD